VPPRRKVGVRTHEDGVAHLDPTYAAAFLGLLRAAEVVDAGLDQDLREAHGIGLRGFEILLHLGAFSEVGSLRMGQLISQAPLSQSRVSRLVAELSRTGYVDRSTAVEDTRAAVVTITPAGRNLLRAAAATHLDGLERRLFARLTKADVAELGRLTAKILGSDAPRTGRGRSPL